ncbi:MAG: T9SS type A sorting domain-containing protein [Paludibacteraceae bacterium]|nr:T9SS type A sorting domain-containing protein [Paludibacteraceae bacterium]MBO7367064.1 T9SS type A sorting domain-containing protein [Paludibacteraceae bacterium]
MKKLYNKNKSVSRRFSAAVLTLVASLLCATNVWGGSGYFKNCANDVYISYQTEYDGDRKSKWLWGTTGYWFADDQHGGGASSGVGTYDDIGTVFSLYIDKAYVRTWKENDNVCNGTIYLTTDNWASPKVTKELTWRAEVDLGSNKFNQIWGYEAGDEGGINMVETKDPGNYTIKWYYNNGAGEGCSGKLSDLNNGGQDYSATFTVPGIAAEDDSFGSVATESVGNITYNFNAYGCTTVNASLSGDAAITFADGSRIINGVSITSEAGSIGLKITTTTRKGTYSATLTLKGTYGNKDFIKKVTISAVVEPEHATEVLTGGAKVFAGPEAELTGYLKYNGCDNTLLKRGFFFCGDNNCTPTPESHKVEIAGTTTLNAKDTFSKRFSEAEDGTKLESDHTYRYIAYVYSEANSQFYLSDEVGEFTTPAPCRYDIKDTVYYTLDNTQDPNPCELRFQTMADIRSDMEEEHLDLNGDAMDPWLEDGFLTKPIVIEVVKGTVDYGNPDDHTRDVSLMNVNTYDQAYETPDEKPDYRLIVRAKDANKRPKFLGGFDMRQSRYITLKDLIIDYNYPDHSSHEFSALEFGYYPDGDGGDAPNRCDVGVFTNTDIEIIGCEVDATGFNCIHAVGCEGLKFDQCVFDMKGAGTADNDRDWGASVKLMSCKKVQFTRNSLKGSHSTLLWLQHTQETLVMNNVFWNDNRFTSNVTFIRPVMFNSASTETQKITKLGIYYNTFYLADNADTAYPVDFMRFGGTAQGEINGYDVANIHFKWNNCYSYDDVISARNDNSTAFKNVLLPKANFAYNNFWSKGDGDNKDNPTVPSGLSFPTDQASDNGQIQIDLFHIDVEALVCQSSATDPDELVLKGSLLNIGAKPSTDISGLGVATDVNSDRFHDVIRSEAGGDWSYGAFQQASIAEIDTIVWVGGKSTLWDDRANWTTTSGKKINCANSLSTNLHVVIPDASGVKNVPTIIEWTSDSRGDFPDEFVAAGMGMGGNGYAQTSKFAESITIQEGGAIKGVENLFGDGTLRYEMADNKFTAIRSEWILVGGVIKPVGKDGKVGDVTSGDFYIANHLPHVYMQHFKLESSNIVPGIPFTSLSEKVDANTAFGIYIPDQYGEYKLPAEIFYSYISPDPSKINDGTAPKTFKFEGRFANEEARPTYSITGTGLSDCVFVNNSYPANLNVAKLLADYSSMGLQAKVYNYKGKSWDDVDASSEEEYAVYVKPNNGFVLYAMTSTGDVEPEIEHYGNGSTNYLRSASASTMLKLQVANTVDNTSSTLSVKYEGASLPKAFSYNESTPEIYVPDGSNMYSTYGIDDLTKVIPLTVRNKKSSGSLTVRFALTRADGFESVILEDRLNGVTYDLLEDGAAYCSGIAPGDCAGRFFLNINYAEDEPTAVDENEADSSNAASGIDIYSVNSGSVVISSTDNVMLEQVYITDMSGRTTVKALTDAHYNVLSLDGRQGVYIIKAVGDIASRTEKVIVK